MKTESIILIAGLCFPLLSCGSTDTAESKDVNEDEIWANYGVSYDPDKHSQTTAVRAYAQFRFGGSTGTTLELSSPSKVEVNGEVLEFYNGDTKVVNVNGSSYTLNKDSLTSDRVYKFVWTKRDGSTHENSVTALSTLTVTEPVSNQIVQKNSGFTVNFSADDIDPSIDSWSSFKCFLYEESASGGIERLVSWVFSKTQSAGSANCVFAAGDLNEVTKFGLKHLISVERGRSVSTALAGHPGQGGLISQSYKSPYISIVINE